MADETQKEEGENDSFSPAAPAEEAKEEKTEENKGGVDESVEVPAEFKKLVEQVETMSVLELHQLVKVLEKRFGVSASAVAVAAPAGGGETGAEAQDSFTVELTAVGDAKIQVIKVVKEVLALGLKEAKDLVDAAPSVLKEGVKKEEAEALKAKIEESGAKITLK
ncbi:50S ribosomal protein L7/L12 [Candidatus Kaiserbacteria bacterium]|nr:50S ribosomal protein L7/L12 [Candidatus Kaiserbacteria bacterium]